MWVYLSGYMQGYVYRDGKLVFEGDNNYGQRWIRLVVPDLRVIEIHERKFWEEMDWKVPQELTVLECEYNKFKLEQLKSQKQSLLSQVEQITKQINEQETQ